MISIIIVEEESVTREYFKSLLNRYSDIELVAEASDADAGVELINSNRPDIAFLNIQMNGTTAFDIMQKLQVRPHVVLLTSEDCHGLRAFEADALDYIRIPIDCDRFSETVRRMRVKISEAEMRNTGCYGRNALRDSDHVYVKDGDQCWFVKLSEVRMFESVGNYARIFFGANKPLILKSLTALEERLDSRTFFRTGRKNIVNIKWIKNVDPYFNGGMLLELKGGEKIEVSRRQAMRFKDIMSL